MALCADRYTGYTGLTPAFTMTKAASGVAPLLVWFDATATTDSSVTYPFHELLYIWDFGDGSAGTWTYGNAYVNSKNVAYGPIAAHVYESSVGSPFTVTLTVYNGLVSKSTTQTVTVVDPDTYYSTTNTTVCSTDGTFTGKPTGATELTTSDFDADVAPLLAAGKRVLLRTGQTFTASTVSFLTTGPWTLGTYNNSGAGSRANVPTPAIITVGHASGVGKFNNNIGSTIDDMRVMDLKINGASTGGFFSCGGGFDNTLFLRVEGYGSSGQGFSFDVLNSLNSAIDTPYHQPRNIGVYDCYFHDNATDNVFAYSDKFSQQGNRYVNIEGSNTQCTRVQYFWQYVFSHNDVTGVTNTYESVAMRNASAANGTKLNDGTSNSKQVIVSDNVFTSTGQSHCQIEAYQDAIFERNFGSWSGGLGSAFLKTYTKKISFRNNICDQSIGTQNQPMLLEGAANASLVSDDVWVYANSVGSAMATANRRPLIYWMFLNGAYTTGDSIVKNNLAYWTNVSTTTEIILNSGSGTLTSTNNSTKTQARGGTDCFTAQPAVAVNDYIPIAYGLAAQGGADTTVPVFQDYKAARRSYGNKTPVIDMGAVQTS